jgi:hypothetical protein
VAEKEKAERDCRDDAGHAESWVLKLDVAARQSDEQENRGVLGDPDRDQFEAFRLGNHSVVGQAFLLEHLRNVLRNGFGKEGLAIIHLGRLFLIQGEDAALRHDFLISNLQADILVDHRLNDGRVMALCFRGASRHSGEP